MKNQSLQDQLLNAGLVNKSKAKQVRTEKRKQSKKKQKNKVEVVDEAKQLVQDARAKQLEKDKLLNQQLAQQAEKKQIENQIIQLIDLNKLEADAEGLAYNFNHDNKVKTIYISDDVRNKIISGRLAIVKSKKTYEVVAVEVAEKIAQRNESTVVVLFKDNAESSAEDEYKDFQIPDDLMW